MTGPAFAAPFACLQSNAATHNVVEASEPSYEEMRVNQVGAALGLRSCLPEVYFRAGLQQPQASR